MKKSSIRRHLISSPLLMMAFYSSTLLAQSAAQFSGGACASQGDWVQSALDQSGAVVVALQTLRDDPNCSALIKSLDNSDQLTALSQGPSDSTSSMSGVFSELQAIREYVSPASTQAAMPEGFRGIVNQLVFRKSLDTVNDIYSNQDFANLSPDQKQNVGLMSARLKSFLGRSETVSKVAVATARGIMAALPQNQLCFSNRPSEAALIFSSIVSSTAALATGGKISNIGEMVSSLVQFDRQMHFANILKGVELARYRTSMSCLVESTQEAYCALQDGQDALNFSRDGLDSSQFVENIPKSVSEQSMQGLIVLLRDTPIITTWLQKILFGIDPKLIVEANMKNSNWDSVISFIKSKNTLLAIYREKRQIYLQTSQGQDLQNKAAMVKDILQSLVDEMQKSPGDDFPSSDTSSSINFFTNSRNPQSIPFFLLGVDLPSNFNTVTNSFDNIYLTWIREQSHGLNNPDLLVENMGDRLNQLIDMASQISSSYFSARMIVDPQNLIVEGMNGPSVSPYKALWHVEVYLQRLIEKLNAGMQDPHVMAQPTNVDAYKAMIPLLQDLIARIDKMMKAMSDISSSVPNSTDISSDADIARKKMDIIYEAANMLTSRDSFIANRVANAVRMDVTDTLWRPSNDDSRQDDTMRVMGRDIITRLSKYYNNDPILQRLDIAQAAPIHEQNLIAVEQLFAKNYWDQLTGLNCSLFGGAICENVSDAMTSPGQSWWASFSHDLMSTLTLRSLWAPIRDFLKQPIDDAVDSYNLRAKLCAQTLGFSHFRDQFHAQCSGAVLASEFSDAQDTKGLNFSYDKTWRQIKALESSEAPGHLSAAKTLGTCSLRSYVRRNLVYRMYLDIQE